MLLVDAHGIPLSLIVSGANRHDASQLGATLDAIIVWRPDSSAYQYHHSPEGISLIQFPGLMASFTECTDFTVDVDDFVGWHNVVGSFARSSRCPLDHIRS